MKIRRGMNKIVIKIIGRKKLMKLYIGFLRLIKLIIFSWVRLVKYLYGCL